MLRASLLPAVLSFVWAANCSILMHSTMAQGAATTTSSGSGAEQVNQPLDARRPIRDKWALVVGISNFENSKVPALKYSTKDARDFYNYLIKDAN
ncbi:MAG: hypothetical protein K2Y39_24730, partial [Candidatus Obscuribacterales bacterium]|nr:hypothetical protein [Candidatus Obscuribacterales bacterium]